MSGKRIENLDEIKMLKTDDGRSPEQVLRDLLYKKYAERVDLELQKAILGGFASVEISGEYKTQEQTEAYGLLRSLIEPLEKEEIAPVKERTSAQAAGEMDATRRLVLLEKQLKNAKKRKAGYLEIQNLQREIRTLKGGNNGKRSNKKS